MLRPQFDMKRGWNAVIYLRMSSRSQNSRSPEQQLATIKETLQRLKLPWRIVAVYRDESISGQYQRKRHEYQRMLRDLKSGAVAARLVLIDTFERLSRADDAPDLRPRLQRMGVLVLTADSGFSDPTSPAGKALGMLEAMRATEVGRVKAHDVLRGKKDAIRLKQWPGSAPPFGYKLRNVMVQKNGVERIDHRELEPDPATRRIVEEIFRLADEKGWGTPKLAKHLNSDPHIPQEHKPFQPSTIGGWLDSEIYCGELVWGKNCTGIVNDVRILQPLQESEWERYPDFCEPIVTRDVWNRVQALRNARRQRHRQARLIRQRKGDASPCPHVPGIALKYLLSGLVRCQRCGRAMTPSSSGPYETKNGEVRRYVAYLCPGRSAGLCTNGRRIPEAWLRDAVLDLIRTRLFLRE